MSRPADPGRTRRGTGHRPVAAPPAVMTLHGPPARDTSPPPGLPEGAHPLWHTIVAELEMRGLRAADLEALRLLVVAGYRHAQIAEAIDRTGLIINGASGPILNPLLKEERAQAHTYMRIANDYGLTIAARIRLGLMQLAGQSILASLNADLDAG